MIQIIMIELTKFATYVSYQELKKKNGLANTPPARAVALK